MLTRTVPALAGMSFLFSLIYLGLTVYFFMLLSRATNALERIAAAMESKNPTDGKS